MNQINYDYFSIRKGSMRLDCLSIFNVFMLFSKESANNNRFFEKILFKKLFNFEDIFPFQH